MSPARAGGGAHPARTNRRAGIGGGRQTARPPSAAELRAHLPLSWQPIATALRLPVPPLTAKNQREVLLLQALSQSTSEPKNKPIPVSSRPQPPEVRVAPAGGPCYGAGTGRSPRSPPPRGVSRATHAMTRPLGEGVPSRGLSATRSRRHFTPAAAGRQTAQDLRYRRGTAEGAGGVVGGGCGRRRAPRPPGGAPLGSRRAPRLPACTAAGPGGGAVAMAAGRGPWAGDRRLRELRGAVSGPSLSVPAQLGRRG